MKNNEIKEILEELKRRNDRYNYYLKEDISFSDEDYRTHLLLDYITNLQEKLDFIIDRNDEKQERIDKAIKLISKEFLCYDNESDEYIQGKKAINILQGSEENDNN